ncbi:MAG: hypothetical protein ACTSPI_11655 [Candidatus Heimdallarchaeaceae archaeon]
MPIKYDCCNKTIPYEVCSGVTCAKIPEESYYISIKLNEDKIGVIKKADKLKFKDKNNGRRNKKINKIVV